MSQRGKGPEWTRTSGANISGNVPKVAQGLEEKVKGKYSGGLGSAAA